VNWRWPHPVCPGSPNSNAWSARQRHATSRHKMRPTSLRALRALRRVAVCADQPEPYPTAPGGSVYTIDTGSVFVIGPICLQIQSQLGVGPTRKCRFKPEIRPLFSQLTNPFQQQPPGPQVLGLRCKWRQPSSDQVRVQELPALYEIGQELRSERRLSRPIGTGNHVDRRWFGPRLAQLTLLSSFGPSVSFAASPEASIGEHRRVSARVHARPVPAPFRRTGPPSHRMPDQPRGAIGESTAIAGQGPPRGA
jgi:hypothetical protein